MIDEWINEMISNDFDRIRSNRVYISNIVSYENMIWSEDLTAILLTKGSIDATTPPPFFQESSAQ